MTALGSAGPFTLVVDYPVDAGGLVLLEGRGHRFGLDGNAAALSRTLSVLAAHRRRR